MSDELTVYFKGDKAKLTGNTEEKYGETWHEAVMQEGRDKGKSRWLTTENVERQTQQKGFSFIEVLTVLSIALIIAVIAIGRVPYLRVKWPELDVGLVAMRIFFAAIILGIGYAIGYWDGRFNRP